MTLDFQMNYTSGVRAKKYPLVKKRLTTWPTNHCWQGSYDKGYDKGGHKGGYDSKGHMHLNTLGVLPKTRSSRSGFHGKTNFVITNSAS